MKKRDEISKAVEIQNVSRKLVESFLQTELRTSITFAQAALSAGDNSDKRERNQANARKGYDTLVRFTRKFSLSPSSASDFADDLQRLKSLMQSLGESDL